MFTGIVEDLGRIGEVRRSADLARLRIATRLPLADVKVGDSVAVDGTCLTVVATGGGAFDVDAASETLARTTIGERKAGDEVHLELALRLGDRLGGHLVTGHVDGVGAIRARSPRGDALHVRYEASPELLRYVVVKGSIAVDGCSLTVNAVDATGFEVVLIPHTLEVTHLARRPVGARVNLETDLIGKYVERLLAGRAAPTLDRELLREHGYIR